MGPIIAAGTAVAIDTAREPEPERRPPAEPEPEPGPGLEPDARCVDDAGSEDRANTAVDPWEIGPLPSASNPVGNDIPADAPASEPQHVVGAVEPVDLADTIDLTPVGDRDAAMPVREWRRIATTAGGILLAACVTVAGMSAWRSHESATAARELGTGDGGLRHRPRCGEESRTEAGRISRRRPARTGESGHGRQARRPGNPGNPRQAGRTIFRGRANPRMCRHGHGNGQRHHIQAASHRKEAHGKSLAAEEGGGRGVLLTAGPYRRTGRTIVFLLRRQGAGRIFSRPAARLHRQARREGHPPTPWTR